MIEAAWDRDGAAAADQFLNELLVSRKRKDRQRLADVLVRFESYCRTGTLKVPMELNDLRDGIREIKAGDVRLPFFHVDPSPAGAVRLTHGFLKGTQRAPFKEIARAIGIRREDGKR